MHVLPTVYLKGIYSFAYLGFRCKFFHSHYYFHLNFFCFEKRMITSKVNLCRVNTVLKFIVVNK